MTGRSGEDRNGKIDVSGAPRSEVGVRDLFMGWTLMLPWGWLREGVGFREQYG